MGIRFAIRLAATVAFGLWAGTAMAQESFYKGRTISLIIGNNASGGFDTYGRLVGRYLPKHLDGHPNLVVQNMPGAGGVRAANTLYNSSPKDGTVLGMIDQAAYLNQLLGVQGHPFTLMLYNTPSDIIGAQQVETSEKRSQELIRVGIAYPGSDLVQVLAASTPELPPPITATGLPLNKGPSQCGQ